MRGNGVGLEVEQGRTRGGIGSDKERTRSDWRGNMVELEVEQGRIGGERGQTGGRTRSDWMENEVGLDGNRVGLVKLWGNEVGLEVERGRIGGNGVGLEREQGQTRWGTWSDWGGTRSNRCWTGGGTRSDWREWGRGKGEWGWIGGE